MKKGIHYWALPTELPLARKFRFAKECGYDGVELALLREGAFRPNCSAEELREIRRAADGEGIALPSITNTLSWTCSFTSGRKEIREKAADVLKQEIDIASMIGAEAVLALPGFVHMNFSANGLHPLTDTSAPGDYCPSGEVVEYAEAYGRSVESYRALASYASDTKYVRSYFDVGNVCPYGIPEQWIRILGERIERVHFKDYVGSAQSLDCFVPLLAGRIDFQKTMRALRDIGYDGWVTAEVNGNPQAPGYIAQITSKALDDIFQLGGESNGELF